MKRRKLAIQLVLAFFVWTAISALAVPFGQVGIRTIDDEERVVGFLKENLPQPGIYLFPGFAQDHELTDEEQAAWAAKYQAGPVGFLVYRPVGTEPMSFSKVLIQIGSGLLTFLILTYVAMLAGPGYWRRVLVVTLLALVPLFTVLLPYWNWYGFPLAFTAASAADLLLGFFVAGLVIALVLQRSEMA